MFLGLPLRLLAEEVVYLLRKGVAVLIDETRAYMPPTADERETFLEQEQQQIQAQKERTLQHKMSSAGSLRPSCRQRRQQH